MSNSLYFWYRNKQELFNYLIYYYFFSLHCLCSLGNLILKLYIWLRVSYGCCCSKCLFTWPCSWCLVPVLFYYFYFYFIISELDVVNTGSRFNCALLIPQAPPKEKKLWFHPLLLFFHPDTNNNNDTNSANIKSCYTIFFTTCTRLLSSVYICIFKQHITWLHIEK